MTRSILVLPLILFVFVQIANAQTYYVNPTTGKDSNPGTETEPFATLEKSVMVANELTGRGQIIIKLFPGLYILKDKLVINPTRIMDDTSKYVIEAVTMPDDTAWTPYQLPVIQSSSPNNSNTQFRHAVGFLVASDNVVIRGLKFIGNPKNFTGVPRPETSYYYPITKENKNLKNLEVSQCYFIAEKNSSPIQGGIWVDGPNTHIDHCVFYNCRNAILLFNSVEGFSITNCIIYGAYESAFWMGPIDSAFTFQNNIVTKCNFFWVRPSNISPNYHFSNSVISENNHYIGVYGKTDSLIETSNDKNLVEKNVTKTGTVMLVELKNDRLPRDFLQVLSGSAGYATGAGIFHKKNN